ncbi:RIKEN cDNA 4631402N15, isoform CRA_a [Mus musculus]|nr:RIKEN cDNA 4631402N15, isoform CRA_a [Mus musculus]EDL10888.1 RIKEN cDNA 4631402N15, isoform CRA_a [Mus musculus]
MRRVVRSNMASHCASSSQCSANSTTFRTIIRLRGSGCEELTRPSRILSIVATLQGQALGIKSWQRQPRGAAKRPGGEELGANQQQDRPPPPPPQQPHLSSGKAHPSRDGSERFWDAERLRVPAVRLRGRRSAYGCLAGPATSPSLRAQGPSRLSWKVRSAFVSRVSAEPRLPRVGS